MALELDLANMAEAELAKLPGAIAASHEINVLQFMSNECFVLGCKKAKSGQKINSFGSC